MRKKIFSFLALFLLPYTIQANSYCYSEIQALEIQDNDLELSFQRIWQEKLRKQNIPSEVITEATRENRLLVAKQKKCEFYIEFQYVKKRGVSVQFFAQIYNPESGKVIDGQSYTSDLTQLLEGIDLDKSELMESESVSMDKFLNRVFNSIRSNPRRIVRNQNIIDHVQSSPIAKREKLPIEEKSIEKESQEVFQLLAVGEDSISIVSRRVDGNESAKRASAIVSVVSRQKIKDMGARNLADILKSIPGVEVFYNQFGFYTVAFRGIRSKSGVLLLLDGHRLNNFYDGSTFLDIRADAIEKVEIIRGPGSSVHGTNAFVGVINVVTRNEEKKGWGELAARGGSQNTFEPSVYLNNELFGDWRIQTYLSQFQSERPKIHVPHDVTCTPTQWSDPTNRCRGVTIVPLRLATYNTTNDFKRQNNGFLKIYNKDLFYISGKVITESRGPHVGEINELTPDSELEFSFLNYNIGTEKLELTDKISFFGRLYGDRYNRRDDIQVQRFDRRAHLFQSPRKIIEYQYDTWGGEVIGQYNILDNLLFMVGFQYERLRVKDFSIVQNFIEREFNQVLPLFWDYDNLEKKQNAERTIQAEFVQFIYDPFKWLSITLGVRRDRYSDFGETVNPKGGVVFLPMQDSEWGTLVFKILYGTAFRAPTFQELYDETQINQIGGVFGNPELKPETIQTFELGLDYTTPYKPLSILVNGYYNQIENNIVGLNLSSTYPGETDKFTNLRGITVLGAEVESRLNYSKRNYFFVNYSWFQSIDYGGYPPFTDRDNRTFLTDVPQARANLGVNFEITKYFTMNHTVWYSSIRESNTRYAFERVLDRAFSLPQYHIWNLSLATTEDLIKNAEFRFTVFNVNNFKLYEDANIASTAFLNRSIPSGWIWGRYYEMKGTIFLQ